jgi:hypothetical protein
VKKQRLAVAIYNTHREAEAAIQELQATGTDMKQLSIVDKDYQTEGRVVGYESNGLTAVGCALHMMGIPKSSVVNYESALKANKFLVVVHVENPDAAKAEEILRRTNPIELAAHGSDT